MFVKAKGMYWKLIPVVLFTLFLLIYIVFELTGVITVSDIERVLRSFEPFSMVLIMVLLISDLLIPIPSSVVMTFSGRMYGFINGGLIALLGSLTASIIGFLIFRKTSTYISKYILSERDQQSMNESFSKWGEGVLILSRMIPLLTETMSCYAGLTSISLKRFLLVITLGTVPVVFYYSYFGSQLETVSQWPLPLAIGLIIPGIVWIILRNTLKKRT
jgi:uncharacterized membrane protein YdjX (TVP38/TMEM64 family)